jgi:hypothetical protein
MPKILAPAKLEVQAQEREQNLAQDSKGVPALARQRAAIRLIGHWEVGHKGQVGWASASSGLAAAPARRLTDLYCRTLNRPAIRPVVVYPLQCQPGYNPEHGPAGASNNKAPRGRSPAKLAINH